MALISGPVETTTGYVQRSFYYYDIYTLEKKNEKFVQQDDQEERFYKAFEELESLYVKKELEKLSVPIDNGDRLYIIPDEIERGKPIQYRLVLVRTNGFPLVEQNGALNSLTDFIQNDFGLAEITHCVIFPDSGILGSEYNHAGARATAIKEYLPRVTQEIEYIYCTPHLRDDILKKIEEVDELSLFQLKVKNTPEMKKYIMGCQSAFFLPFVGMPESSTYEVTMKRGAGKSRKGFKSPMSKKEIEDFISNCGDDINVFKISVGDIQKDAVDLIRQKVVYRSAVIRTANKSIDSQYAYNIIINYFNNKLKMTL